MGKGKAAAPTDNKELDPETFLKNYKFICSSIGIKPSPEVMDGLVDDEMPPNQISVDSVLGPAGVRAIVEALMGNREGMDGPFRMVNTLRFWRSDAKNEGAISIAELLRSMRGIENGIAFLQLLDNKISTTGAKALGSSLAYGANTSLLALNLDHNQTLGSAGAQALFKGLRTNCTLKRLSLQYCNIDSDASKSLRIFLSHQGLAIEQINLKGNTLGGEGLKAISNALSSNIILNDIDYSDNAIGEDEEALKAFAAIMKTNTTLVKINLEQNHIGEKGANALLESGVFDPAEGNKTLKDMLVDINLPIETFTALMRASGGGKGKKGKKGKKK